PPEEVEMMDKAESYDAHAVFFEAGRNGYPPRAQAFIFISDGPTFSSDFARLHKRLWNWGGVPLLYRRTRDRVQLFRCAHKADFVSVTGDFICNPVKTLMIASEIASDPWWDSEQLRNGTLWNDKEACRILLSATGLAHKGLIDAVKDLS